MKQSIVDHVSNYTVGRIFCILELSGHFKPVYFSFEERICHSLGSNTADEFPAISDLFVDKNPLNIYVFKCRGAEGRMQGRRCIYHRQVAVPLEL